MTKKYFQQFTKKKNSVIKEEFKQAKKKQKKEKEAAINERFEEKRRMKQVARDLAEAARKEAEKIKKAGGVVPKATEAKQLSVGNTQKQVPMVNNQPVTINDKRPVLAKPSTEQMPLNKFLAHCGVSGRREAADIIKEGKVKVNGQVITEPGFKVSETDDVNFNGKKLFVTKNLVYILLNKPKDYLTTTDDPQGRKTVLSLIRAATTERVYPIGRLDRNTSGVLLFTNDGELTQKLSHPSYGITKVYEVKLDKVLAKTDFEKILAGIKLEDGDIKADSLAYADARDKSVIGIEIHSGRNRIVRRIFEHLGYEIKGLDRVMFANLTKKNVERGKWRFLNEKEIRLLKYLNKSKAGPATTSASGTDKKPTTQYATTKPSSKPKPAPKAVGKPSGKSSVKPAAKKKAK